MGRRKTKKSANVVGQGTSEVSGSSADVSSESDIDVTIVERNEAGEVNRYRQQSGQSLTEKPPPEGTYQEELVQLEDPEPAMEVTYGSRSSPKAREVLEPPDESDGGSEVQILLALQTLIKESRRSTEIFMEESRRSTEFLMVESRRSTEILREESRRSTERFMEMYRVENIEMRREMKQLKDELKTSTLNKVQSSDGRSSLANEVVHNNNRDGLAGEMSVNQNSNYGNQHTTESRHPPHQWTEGANTSISNSSSVKIPPFNGKESWKVWQNRFQTIADLEGWTERRRLKELLPKLQGVAGEFVFSQLPQNALGNYQDLVSELQSRFRIIETRKTYESQFNRRHQSGESFEDFAADLKCLYDKAHQVRHPEMRRENLLRRFMSGVSDDRARFEVEFHKEPKTIDEAVQFMVAYMEAKKRGTSQKTSNVSYGQFSCDSD